MRLHCVAASHSREICVASDPIAVLSLLAIVIGVALFAWSAAYARAVRRRVAAAAVSS